VGLADRAADKEHPTCSAASVQSIQRIGGVLVRTLTEQLFVAKGWTVVDVTRHPERDALVVRVAAVHRKAVCSGCGETKLRLHDTKGTREWRHLDGWGVRTFVSATLRRVRCRNCRIRVELVPWARPRSRFTHAMEADVLRRARDTSIAGVCRQLGLHWTSVMRLIERWVEESAARQFRRSLRVIGVDEVSYGRGQSKYLTIVWDHVRGRVVWIGQGRERDTLDQFFTKLGTNRSRRLVAVTMDMWQGYIGSVEANAPQADIVFDRFHIERYLTRAVDEVRKQEFFRRGGVYRNAIRGKKWLLLTKHRRLRRKRRVELMGLLIMNKHLFRAYVVKEQFEHAWTYTTEQGMREFLVRWRKLLNWSRLHPLIEFYDRLMRHVDGVTAWARYRLTNAALEGNNSRVRGLSQRAHGYRNPANLMLVLYHASWR
jgi:transposase